MRRPRIAWLGLLAALVTALGSAASAQAKPSLLRQWPAVGEPGDLAIGPSGDLYESDSVDDVIVRYTPDGTTVGTIGTPGSGPGQLDSPGGLDFDAHGDLYVADNYNDRIEKFTADGRYLATFGSRGGGDGQFMRPASLRVTAAGDLYVGDSANNRLEVLDHAGRLVRMWGNGVADGADRAEICTAHCRAGLYGNGAPGTFDTGPIDVAFSPDGSVVYATDPGNFRVQEFTPGGRYLGSFGHIGAAEGELDGAGLLTVDRDAHVWLGDSGDHVIDEFGPDGHFIQRFGQGIDDDHFFGPSGFDLDCQGHIWVADFTGWVDEFASTGTVAERCGSPPPAAPDPAPPPRADPPPTGGGPQRPTAARRRLSLRITRRPRRHGAPRRIRLGGLIVSPRGGRRCDARQRVVLQRRRGGRQYRTFAAVRSSRAGHFALRLRARHVRTYRAMLRSTSVCRGVTSPPRRG